MRPSYRGVLALCAALAGFVAHGAEAPWPLQRWSGDRAQDAAAAASTAPQPSRGWTVCAVYPHLKDNYWLAVNFGMADEARRLGIGLTVRAANGYEDLEQQRARVRECTTDTRTDALLVGTVSFSGLNDLLQAYGARHPVLALVNDIDSAAVHGKIGVPWYQLGWQIGRWLAERHPAGSAPVDIGWFPGPRTAGWVPFIDRGFRAAIDDSAVRLAVVKWGDTGRSTQRRLVEDALDEQPGLRYLVGNAPMAETAVGEVRRRNLQAQIGIVASYLTPGVHDALRRGRILASVTDFPVLQGRLAIRQILASLEGQAVEAHVGPRVELVESAQLAHYRVDWMLPPAGFEPVFEVAPAARPD
jgi:protein TorT